VVHKLFGLGEMESSPAISLHALKKLEGFQSSTAGPRTTRAAGVKVAGPNRSGKGMSKP
jgi:hypothetical protein